METNRLYSTETLLPAINQTLEHLSPAPNARVKIVVRGEHSIIIPRHLIDDNARRAAGSLLPELLATRAVLTNDPCEPSAIPLLTLFLNVDVSAFKRVICWLDTGIRPMQVDVTSRDGREAWAQFEMLVRRLRLRHLLIDSDDNYIPGAEGPFASRVIEKCSLRSCCEKTPVRNIDVIRKKSEENALMNAASDLTSLQRWNRAMHCRSNVDFSYLDLSYVDFSDMDFRGANFDGANLTGASFARSDLTNANLSNANLFGADLQGAALKGVDLSGALLAAVKLSVMLTCYACNNKGNSVLAFARGQQWRERNDIFFHYGIYNAACHYRPGDR